MDPLREQAHGDGLTRELALARDAIELVSSDTFRSVTLGSLRHARVVLEVLDAEADGAGVELLPLGGPDISGVRVGRTVPAPPRLVR